MCVDTRGHTRALYVLTHGHDPDLTEGAELRWEIEVRGGVLSQLVRNTRPIGAGDTELRWEIEVRGGVLVSRKERTSCANKTSQGTS